ncbi:peptidylprolyl isomerase [Paenibacillus arenilitoris]|uniref:peptidylprolyl isomerase n=1 Tax=Paenibacillus arenilitoris TaxID=2772299 RepID=A0A927CNC8_9BACL|nr:peptidylprolyl isomerase [Paenibacillus arenilitoris]MBD2868765.1 peptidyl-prolyl cis-trans isomerase [Paenibacillus arenilitoris]
MRLKKQWTAAVWLSAAILVAVGGAIAYSASARSGSGGAPVAEVNGSPVAAQEFAKELERQRAAVIDYFQRERGAAYEAGFWTADYGGENPEEKAKDMALRQLVRVKVELELTRRHGLVQGTTYADLLAAMDNENKRRREAVEANRPVYGPVRLDESSFLPYYLSNLRNGLKEALAEGELRATDEELERHYELVKDRLFAGEERIGFRKLSVPYRMHDDRDDADERSRQSAKALLDSARRLLESGRSPEEAARELDAGGEAGGIRYSEEELNEGTAGTYFKSQPALYAALSGGLKAGQVSEPFDEAVQGEYVLIQITEREETGHAGFEEKERAVRDSYMDAAYNAYLERLVRDAEVIVHTDELDKIAIR